MPVPPSHPECSVRFFASPVFRSDSRYYKWHKNSYIYAIVKCAIENTGLRIMIIADIMTAKPVTVDMDTELLVIKEIFDHVYFHHLLVEDETDNTFAGVISDRDLLSAISPYIHTAAETWRDQETLKKRAHQIMSRQVDTVTPATDCNSAVQKMLNADISCMPVVDDNNVILGIVTWKDFLTSYLKQQSPENYKHLIMKQD